MPEKLSLAGPGVAPYAAAAARIVGQSSSGVAWQDFRLAGGTALAWYLGHRISDDLDFFTYRPGTLDSTAQSRLAAVLTPLTVPGSVDVSAPRTVHAMLTTPDGPCKLSFFEIGDAVWVDEPVAVREGFFVASLRDIGAMKLLAVGGRCTKKDFYDLVALERHGLPVPALFAHARRMYARLDDMSDREHLRRSLAYHAEAETDPDPVTLIGTTWTEAKEVAVRAADDLARRLDRGFEAVIQPPSVAPAPSVGVEPPVVRRPPGRGTGK